MFSPALLVLLIFCVAPLLIFTAGVVVGRRGTPMSIQWNWGRGAGAHAGVEEE